MVSFRYAFENPPQILGRPGRGMNLQLDQDLRLAGRLLAKAPGFTAVTVLILALGIGVTTAVASVFRAVLIDTLPYEEPDELLSLRGRIETTRRTGVAWREYLAWRERNRTFEDIAAHRQVRFPLLVDGGLPESVIAIPSTANLFSMLGEEPYLGRTFTASEDTPGGAAVAILSYPFWQSRFGGRESVLEEALRTPEEAYEIIGVMKPRVLFPGDFRATTLWIPIGRMVDEDWGWSFDVNAVSPTGRLRDGVTFDEAWADMDRIAAELAAEHPDTHRGRGILLQRISDRILYELGQDLGTTVRLLAVAVGGVLAIAWVNVASLLLVRGIRRRRELAVRRALGAPRRRLLRLLLVESVLLAVLGAVAGLAVAFATLQGLLAVIDLDSMPPFGEITIDGKILAFTLCVATSTGLVFGLAPALTLLRPRYAEVLHERADSSSRHGGRVLGTLVVIETGLALALALSAVLAVSSFRNLVTSDHGFDSENLLIFTAEPPLSVYDERAKVIAYLEELVRRVEAVPGVESAATTVPLGVFWSSTFEVVGRPPEENKYAGELFTVSPGYFETMRIPLLRGRTFLPGDRADAPGVVIVDRVFAKAIWPDEDPLGQRLRVGADPPDSSGRLVVGIVEHVKHSGVHLESGIIFYLPAAQGPEDFGTVVARTEIDPWDVLPAVRREAEALDPTVLFDEWLTVGRRLERNRDPQRLMAILLGLFAGLAVLLAAVGIYSVVAYAVAERRGEIAVRMALGARGGDVTRHVLRQGLGLAFLGVTAGLGLAALGARLLASYLYATDPYDPVTWIVLAVLVGCGMLLVCAVPAWRASREQPAAVLHHE